jgi:carbonic anhydrase/acetyltransferase-like protein (isoleucine patch superfamily)
LTDWKQFLASKPEIGQHVFIAATAFLTGRIKIADYASVWPGVAARGDVNWMRIGRRTNIQDNSVLHLDVDAPLDIGNDITVGHGCVLHGCTIKDRCLVGMGSIVLNGAVVGPDVILGAGSLVKQNDVIPPGTLYLGAPAKYKRDLTPAEIASILESAKHYSEFALEYLKTSGG